MTRNEFLDEIADLLELDRGEVSGDEKLEDLPWDSLAETSFVAVCDFSLGRTISAGELADCRTVNDLVNLVEDTLT